MLEGQTIPLYHIEEQASPDPVEEPQVRTSPMRTSMHTPMRTPRTPLGRPSPRSLKSRFSPGTYTDDPGIKALLHEKSLLMRQLQADSDAIRKLTLAANYEQEVGHHPHFYENNMLSVGRDGVEKGEQIGQ